MAATIVRRRIEARWPDAIGTPDLERFIASEERTEAARMLCGPVPPCPPGCPEEPGHDYDSFEWDHETFRRSHTLAQFGFVSIEQGETNCAGTVTLESPTLYVSDEVEEAWTACEARRIAEDLLRAADMLDEIAAVAQ